MKNKKLLLSIGITIVLILVLFIMNLLLTNNSNQSSIVHSTATKQKQNFQLIFAHNTPISSALHQAALRYAKQVHEKSDGKIEIKVYPSQELGNDHQMVEMAREGKIDILLTPTAKMSVPVPSMQYADLPFFFPTKEDVYEMLDGAPGQMLLDDLKSIGLFGVTFWENGFKHFTSNFPIHWPTDFKDKKIRVMKSRIIMDQFKAFEANPITIDFHKTKQALADKVVDGQENPLVAIVSMGFHKEQSNFTYSQHAYLGYVFSISEKTFDKIPKYFHSMLIDTAKEISPWERQETLKREAKLMQEIENEGLEIHTLTDEEKKAFRNKTKDIAKSYEDIIGVDVISKSEEMLYEKYDANKSNHLLLGIDADLSTDSASAGLAIKRGVELAVDEINDRGGILGKPLKVIARDHRAISSRGIANVKHFAKQKNILAIIGGKHSAVIDAELKEINASEIPYIIPWAAAANLTQNPSNNPLLFRVSANDKFTAKYLVSNALNKYGKPLIVVENSIWGRGNLEIMDKYLKQKGINTFQSLKINRSQTNITENIKTSLTPDTKSIIIVANPKEASAVMQSLKNLDSKLPVISHWGVIGGNFFSKNREYLKNIKFEFIQSFSFLRSKNMVVPKLKQMYKKKYSLERSDTIVAPAAVAQAYDGVHLLALAINEVNSTNPDKIKYALEHISKYQGAIKLYKKPFSINDHDALDLGDFYLAKFDKDGKIIPIKR